MVVSEFINKVGFKVNKNDVTAVNNTINGIKSTAAKLLGALGIGFSLNQLRKVTEEFGQVNNSIKFTYQNLTDANEAQKKILETANETRTEYGKMADIVMDLTQTNEELFPIDDATKFATVVQQLTLVSGKSEAEAASVQKTLSQVFRTNIVGVNTLLNIQKQAPALYNEIAKAIGVSREELQEMAAQGLLTSQQLKDAIISSRDTAQLAFNQLDFTISGAMTNIRNKWGFFIADFDKSLGISNTVSRMMVNGFQKVMNVLTFAKERVMKFAEKLGGTENLLKLIAITAGAVLIAFNFDKIVSGLSSFFKMLSSINIKALLIIGAIVLIALLIQDFVYFLQGKDSLLGSLLADAGVDVDEFRQNLIEGWKKFKEGLREVWEGIKEVLIPFLKEIWEGAKNILTGFWEFLKKVAPGVADFLDRLAHGDLKPEEWHKIGTAIGRIVKFLSTPFLLIIIRYLKELGQSIKDNLIQGWYAAKEAWADVKQFFLDVWDSICEAFDSVVDWFGDTFSNAWDAICNAWDSVADWFSGVWDSICEAFSGVVDWFRQTFSDAWEAIKKVFEPIGKFFEDMWATVKQKFTDFGSKVGDAVGGAVKKGINGAITMIENTINNGIGVINGAIGLLRKIGVSVGTISTVSLPRLAEGGYVEPNKPRPVIVGDNRTEGEIVSPISKMRQTVLEALQTFLPHPGPFGGAAAMAGGNTTSNRTVNQNVNINNTFNGDKAFQKNAAKTMDKSATDVTAILARGLAYAK